MLDFDPQGQPVSHRYGDVYKTGAGAWAEAHSVFVAGARVSERWQHRPLFTVLELGFGLGVNFLATLEAWRNDAARPQRLCFVSIEAHPLSASELARAHHALGIERPEARELRERWPPRTPGIHRATFHGGAVSLVLALGDVARMLPLLQARADAIYLDGFAPECNPDMWSLPTMRGVARLARPGAFAASYNVASAVREVLGRAGFEVETLAALGSQRGRIVARYAPRFLPDSARAAPEAEGPGISERRGERSAIVVGGGLAGCAIAGALGARGWSVQILERGSALACEGSAQPMIADHPHLSPDDNRLARLTRAALMVSSDHAQDAPIGRLALAGDRAGERQRAAVQALRLPPEFVRYCERDEAESLAGVGLAFGGLWFPGCRAVDPALECRRWLGRAGSTLRLTTATEAALLERRDGGWAALDATGTPLAHAQIVVLANAGDALRLGLQSVPRLRRLRGQTTLVESGTLPGLATVIGGEAYACPLPDGRVVVGATFDEGETLEPTTQADLSNLRRLAGALCPLPAPLAALLSADFHASGAVHASRHAMSSLCSAAAGFRWVARDRLPLIGALPDERAARANATEHARNDRIALPLHTGLYGAFAFGSRGLLWARLAAEVLGAMLDDEPIALERDLLASIDPARFLRQAVRHARF